MRALHRLFICWTYTLLTLACANAAAQAPSQFQAPTQFEQIAERARTLSLKPYSAPAKTLPAELRNLSYDQLRDIRFKPERAVWRDQALPFELVFFHLGRGMDQPVAMHEVGAQGVRELPFDIADFTYGANRLASSTWGDLGHAGFRLHFPLNRAEYKDEVIAFLGASYFRAVGAGQQYGLSARGLAVDTGLGKPEEFPKFTEFWFERPTPSAKTIAFTALLDSERVAGAYRFVVQPGQATRVTVQARLFFRASATGPIQTLGIAPLTSMFSFGENQPHRQDFRPEVHDSDGLMVATGDGEWLWRPLQNPKQTLVTSFAAQSLRGFGLMQRDRSFASYEDAEAHYERRPSAWITPLGNWGPGRVELVQLPAADEAEDNIVAYWVPKTLPRVGEALNLKWNLDWQGDGQQLPPLAWVAQTRVGRGYAALAPDEQQLVVDFMAPDQAPDADITAQTSSSPNCSITSQTLHRLDANGAWRLVLRVKTLNPKLPVELRASLHLGSTPVSETWTYVLPAQ